MESVDSGSLNAGTIRGVAEPASNYVLAQMGARMQGWPKTFSALCTALASAAYGPALLLCTVLQALAGEGKVWTAASRVRLSYNVTGACMPRHAVGMLCCSVHHASPQGADAAHATHTCLLAMKVQLA